MDAPLLYGIVVAGCIAAFVVRRRFNSFSRSFGPTLTTFILKHVVYPYLLPRIPLLGSVFPGRAFIGPVSRMQALLQVAYWASTAVCNILGVESLSRAGARAGTIAIFNLIPLTLGDRLSSMATILGVPPRVACRIHSTLGLMAVIQALVHVLLSIRRHQFDLKQTSGLVVSTGFER